MYTCMMDAGKQEIKVRRVSSRKRSRDNLRSHLTPAKKRGDTCAQQCPKTCDPADTFCSDNEDLFGDYDSLLEDGSLLAQLDEAERRWAALPSSQQQFKQQMEEEEEKKKEGGRTSTPSKNSPEPVRSVTERLKRTMLGNAASPSVTSRVAAAMQEVVVSEEINVAMETMEAADGKTKDLGPFFGLPTKVKELVFKLKGIQSLYDWQETCLNLDCVQQRRNLIYSLPTSGGKTLVAEILILRELLCRRKDCLLILPYVSLVQEKVRGLASFGLELDILVEEYAGSKGRFPPVKRRNSRSLYVATIEKAHSLVNSLIETDRMDNLGLVVVDELHMLGDGSRGAVIEMTLAKILYTSRATQIIGMSATLGNIKNLQTFLNAEHYSNDFRPVELKEFVKLKDSVYEVSPQEEQSLRFSRRLNLKYSASMQRADPDHIVAMVTEVIPAHSCLLFCPTKKNCENVAAMICKYLAQEFLGHRVEEKAVLLRELRAAGNGCLCPVLRRTVPYGVAYHHSGLTAEERKLLEDAYHRGALCLLTCTSTLAAGVNLPARRVILRSPYVAMDFLKRSQYKQMTGRAGRAGIDTAGESILILQDKDMDMAKSLLVAPVESCFSQLMLEGGKSLQSLILSLIGLNVTSSVQQLQQFLRGTLLWVQQETLCEGRSLWDEVQQSVDVLQERGLVAPGNGQTLQVTRLGRATFKGSVDLSLSSCLYEDLCSGLDSLLLSSQLHLLFLTAPQQLLQQCNPDWRAFYTQFSLLSAAEQKMAAAVGVPESFIARKAAGQTVKKGPGAAAPRLFLAVVLLALLRLCDVWAVAERFQLSRGFVQTLLSSSASSCSAVLHFTQELDELWPFRALLAELTRRLSYCVKVELIPLMEVSGVMESRAKQLYNAGYKTLAHLANADPAALCKAIENLYRKQAHQIVASAKMLLAEKAAALQEEVDELLMAPSDLPQQNT